MQFAIHNKDCKSNLEHVVFSVPITKTGNHFKPQPFERLEMSFLRCSRLVREPLLFRYLYVASKNTRVIPQHGFATNKARPSNESVDIKRPLNAFQLFAVEFRDLAVRENPDTPPQQIIKILADKWKVMSEDEKSPYKNVYAKRLEEYNAPLRKLPKKPPGVFALFVRENFSRLEQKNPDDSAPEIMAKLSSDWKDLPVEEKDELKQKHDELVEMYKEEVIGFDRNLSVEERAFLQQKRGSKMQKLEKEKRKLLGYPKKPPSPFIVFMQKSEGRMENESVTERSKKLGKMWREMGEDEKEVYREEIRTARAKYNVDVTEWKEKNQ